MSEAVNVSGGDDKRLFSPKIVLGMIVAGVFAFSAFVVLSTYAPDLKSGDNGGAHALSRSAVGYAGVIKLLRARGDQVLVTRRSLEGQEPALIVFAPTQRLAKDAFDKVQVDASTLVVLPKWSGPPDPMHPGWVGEPSLYADGDQNDMLKAMGMPKAHVVSSSRHGPFRLTGAPDEATEGLVLDTGPIRNLRGVTGPDLIPVLTGPDGIVVLARRDGTDTYVLADPDLLNTMGMKDIRTARAGVAIIDALRYEGDLIAFDVTLNGFGRSRSVLKLAFEPPFVGATLCLVAAAALMGLHAAARFRAARRGGRALALGKDALVDNSAGLIRMARREPAMAPRYAELQRAAAVRALGGGASRLEGQALVDFLDRQGERFGAADSASELDRETRAVRSLGDLMRVVGKWHQWRLEMTRERR